MTSISTRRMLLGLGSSVIWPAYLAFLSLVAREAPWPRSLAWPLSFALLALAIAHFFANAARMAFRSGGWAEERLGMPPEATRQVRRVLVALAGASMLFLVPELILRLGLIAPGGRPISASSLERLLRVGFQLVVVVIVGRVFRAKSPVITWLAEGKTDFGFLGRQRRFYGLVAIGVVALVVMLDVMGYSFSARRLSFSIFGSLVVAFGCWVARRVALSLIEKNAWHWAQQFPSLLHGDEEAREGSPSTSEVVRRLRKLTNIATPIIGLYLASFVWNTDMALVRQIGAMPLITLEKASVAVAADASKLANATAAVASSVAGEKIIEAITVADAFQAVAATLLTIGIWRYLSTFFGLFIYPRMPDDPGIRFAMLMLTRYGVLAVGVLFGLSALHLGMDKIGVVLAALGVGLGFGLQEIVSNFVSGIILLIERPIRVGDVVSVTGMTGKVDQINIRATTIINSDNQSMIIPNREFITGNLVNWTHKDKIVRLSISVNVAQGTDPDKVSDLLMTIAREDSDVLNNPLPSALMDSFGPSTLSFSLHAFVPEPSLLGRTKHRLCGQIQKRFTAAGIEMPLPRHELRFQGTIDERNEIVASYPGLMSRVDAGMPAIPSAHKAAPPAPPSRPLPAPAAECYRGVDD